MQRRKCLSLRGGGALNSFAVNHAELGTRTRIYTDTAHTHRNSRKEDGGDWKKVHGNTDDITCGGSIRLYL